MEYLLNWVKRGQTSTGKEKIDASIIEKGKDEEVAQRPDPTTDLVMLAWVCKRHTSQKSANLNREAELGHKSGHDQNPGRGDEEEQLLRASDLVKQEWENAPAKPEHGGQEDKALDCDESEGKPVNALTRAHARENHEHEDSHNILDKEHTHADFAVERMQIFFVA